MTTVIYEIRYEGDGYISKNNFYFSMRKICHVLDLSMQPLDIF